MLDRKNNYIDLDALLNAVRVEISIPITIVIKPIALTGSIFSDSHHQARMDAKMGSPKIAVDTVVAGNRLTAQLNIVCPIA